MTLYLIFVLCLLPQDFHIMNRLSCISVPDRTTLLTGAYPGVAEGMGGGGEEKV